MKARARIGWPPAHVTRSLAYTWGPVLALTFLAAVLRIYSISAQPLWFDEAFSLWVARHPVREITYWVSWGDTHPPLYYTLLHLWLGLGDGEAVLRAPSALFGVLTIPLMYGLGRTVGGHRLGMVAALLLATSPLHVHFAQEARMYTLFTMAAALVMWGLATLLRWPDAASQPIGAGWRAWRRGQHREQASTDPRLMIDAAWAAFIGGTLMALLSHNTAVLLLAPSNLIVLGLFWRDRARWRGFLRNWRLANIAVVSLWAAWLPLFLVQFYKVFGRQTLVFAPTLAWMASTFRALYIAPPYLSAPAQVVLGVIVATLAGLGLWGWRRNRHMIAFTLALWLFAPVVELLITIWRPFFLGQTLIWTSLPFYLMAAAGVVQLQRRSVRAIALASVLTLLLSGLSGYYVRPPKEAWDQAAAYVARRMGPGDMILFHANYVQIPFDYYFHRQGGAAPERGVPVDWPGVGMKRDSIRMTAEDVPRLRALMRIPRRLWLVYHPYWTTDPQQLVPSTLATWAQLVDHQIFTGSIQVYLYRLASPAGGQKPLSQIRE